MILELKNDVWHTSCCLLFQREFRTALEGGQLHWMQVPETIWIQKLWEKYKCVIEKEQKSIFVRCFSTVNLAKEAIKDVRTEIQVCNFGLETVLGRLL